MKHSRRWLLAGAALVGLSIASIAFVSPRVGGRLIHGHTIGAPQRNGVLPRLPWRLQFSDLAVQPGSRRAGGSVIAHFAGGRDSQRIQNAGRGQMIYTGADGAEPTLGIDEDGNIFFQGVGPGYGINLGPHLAVSRDGGDSWVGVTPSTHTHTFDPFVYVDSDTGRAFTADLSEFACVTVSHSDDVGESWTSSKACGLSDHQNVFAGPPAIGATIGYPNVVYMCAIDGGALGYGSAATSCLKSLDGGITWVRTGTPAYTDDPRQGEGTFGIPGACGGASGHGFVDAKGIVYLPRGWCSQPYLAISKDEGATWERIQVAGNGMPRSHDILAQFEHEAAVAVDAEGNVYYFWTARNRLPYLAISRDGGRSFSKPMMVGPPGLKEAWGPAIAVGDTGKIALAYVGSTTAPGGRAPDGVGPEYDYLVTWNGYITTSVDALSTNPQFFTTSVNRRSDPIMRGECGIFSCGVQVDFIEVVIGPDGVPWASMVDGCPPRKERCDSFAGFVGTVAGGPTLR